MAKEFFHYPETSKLFNLLEEASHRSGVSRGQAFEDFLTMSVCCLSGGSMEELYLQTVAKHTAGKQGKRGCDSIAQMFAELVLAMEQDTRDEMKDILGDLFEGAISYGEHQQYMTPPPVCALMARLAIGGSVPAGADESPVDEHLSAPAEDAPAPEVAAAPVDSLPRRIVDPACGSGRMLLAAAHIDRRWEFVGQDVDLRCVRMTTLNLAFRNLYGYVIHGNSLALEQKLVYRTGFDGRGFLREVPLATCPAPVQRQVCPEMSTSSAATPEPPPLTDEPQEPKSQLRLF